MKNYKLLGMMPNTNQFFTFIRENAGSSDFNNQTISYKTVYGLFVNSQALYKTLESHTSVRLKNVI
jgi:secreted Zn-dependent insulinase-like peptidase